MKCKKPGCNREFKTEHGMNIHYMHAHVRTSEEKTRIAREIGESLEKTWNNKPQIEKDEKVRKWKNTCKNRTPEMEAERFRQMRETIDNKPHGIFKCSHPDCKDSNKEFETERDMKLHYYQMHIRTPEERDAMIAKIKKTIVNRPPEEEMERIRQMLETTAKRAPEEKAKSIEKGVNTRKITWTNKSQKEKDDIVKQYKITIANKSEKEMIEWKRKIRETKDNWTLEQKEMNIEHRRVAWEKKSQAEKDELTRQMLETKAKRTPEQKNIALANMKKAWENMPQEKLDARYLKTLATRKKNGKGKTFMGEWYQSILEADIAKLLWENLGCIFIVSVNREFPINGSRIDFYPRILGCFIEPHAMNTLYEPLLISQRNKYKKKRIVMKNKNGYIDTELIHYISFKEAKESIEWISDKIADYSPKSLLHSIVNERKEYK